MNPNKSKYNIKDWLSNQNAGGFKDGNTNPSLNDYEYDENDFRVKDFEKVFYEETERSSMIKDRNKGIENITYNHLNLPVEIKWTNNKKINYLYTATGVKVQKKVTNGTNIRTTDYLDGFQYNQQLLEFFPHLEGYVKATALSESPANPQYAFNYVYNYTDHLGNVRVSYTKDPQTGKLKILDESHYYPFGLKHSEYAKYGLIEQNLEVVIAPVTDNPFKYKYNGKEWQDELGLNFYDFEARNYMPDIGRTTTQDPLTERFVNQSSYSFFNNNPIRFADPTGMAGEDFIDVDKFSGKVTVTEAPGDDKMRLIGEGGKVEKIETYGENGSFNRDNNITTNDILDSNGDYLRTEQIIESKNPDKLFNLFEFATSDGNTVEYGFLRAQDGWKSRGYLYTSGLTGSLGDQFPVFFENLMSSSPFLYVTELWHNHNSSFRPSGFEEDGSISEWYGGDRVFQETIKNKYPTRVPQKANILLPNTNLTIRYDEKSFGFTYR